MENNKNKKVMIKIENEEKDMPKDLEIQDSSLDVEREENRPGIGIEIFGTPTNP